jgi:hypothetical protein
VPKVASEITSIAHLPNQMFTQIITAIISMAIMLTAVAAERDPVMRSLQKDHLVAHHRKDHPQLHLTQKTTITTKAPYHLPHHRT